MSPIIHDQVQSKIINIRNQNVILDSDVAKLYGVETKRINEAVARNPEKFPDEYLISLTSDEWNFSKSQFVTSIESNNSKSQFATSNRGGKIKLPTAFTERGLYMLATILKSPKAIQTTIAIIDTFSQIKNLGQQIHQFANAKNDAQRIKIFEDGTEIIADLLDNELIASKLETSFKIKLPFFEVTRKITKVKSS